MPIARFPTMPRQTERPRDDTRTTADASSPRPRRRPRVRSRSGWAARCSVSSSASRWAWPRRRASRSTSMKAGNPYQSHGDRATRASRAQGHARSRAQAERGARDKPRFDFYKILPGGEEPKVHGEGAGPSARGQGHDRRAAAAGQPTRPPRSRTAPQPTRRGPGGPRRRERFWLQAGSFASEARRREPEGAARVGGLGGGRPAGDAARQGRALSGPARALTTTPTSSTASRASSRKRGFDAAVIKY